MRRCVAVLFCVFTVVVALAQAKTLKLPVCWRPGVTITNTDCATAKNVDGAVNLDFHWGVTGTSKLLPNVASWHFQASTDTNFQSNPDFYLDSQYNANVFNFVYSWANPKCIPIYFRVRAIGPNGEQGAWSEIGSVKKGLLTPQLTKKINIYPHINGDLGLLVR